MAARRKSLLEDDELVEIDKIAIPSGGDICDHCGHPRFDHEYGTERCKCGKCEEFIE